MPVRRRFRKRVASTLRKRRSAARRRVTPAAVRKIVRRTVAGSEKKFHDLPLEWNSDLTVSAPTLRSSLVEIPAGSGKNQRTGLRCRVTGIYVKMRVYRSIKPDSSQANGPIMLRWGIDEVKNNVTESALSAFPVRGYFDSPDYINYTKRVVADSTITIPYGGDGDMWGPFRTVTRLIRFRKPHFLNFSTTGTDDPVTGNLLAWVRMENRPTSEINAQANVQCDFRLYFSEV